jgi:hypothetical protein
MRIYVPSTVPLVARALSAGTLPAGLTAFAVTPGLHAWYVEGDDEELEYAATSAAARGSLRLVDADPGALPRRVVLAADVPDGRVTVRDDEERGAIRVADAIPLSAVVSAHVDGDDAVETVAAAASAVTAADLGDTDAEFTVDSADGFELLWYATQELPELLSAWGVGEPGGS